MRRLALVPLLALLLMPAAAGAGEWSPALPDAPGERYADGGEYAREALDRLLSRDLGDEAPAAPVADAPGDC